MKIVDRSTEYYENKDSINSILSDVLNSGTYIGGYYVNKFEKELANKLKVDSVVSCANGTDALQLVLMALNFQENSEIITTPFSFCSAVEVIKFLKLNIKYVDIEDVFYNIDVTKIKKEITIYTKAIIATNLFGKTSNVLEIRKILKEIDREDIIIIEDNAQSLFARHDDDSYLAGDIATTSFFPTKNLAGYGDGGAIYTNNRELAEKCKKIKSHGSVDKYNNDEIGINSRLDSIQAALLSNSLERIDKKISKKIENVNLLNSKLTNVITPQTHINHTYNQYCIRTTHRDELKLHLQRNNIDANIYYPIPLHHLEPYKEDYTKKQFPKTNKACKEILSIPIHEYLTEDEINKIVDIINDYYYSIQSF